MITELTSCVACDSTKLSKILNLGLQPLANSYLKDPTEYQKTFPLQLNYCNTCTHLQLSHSVDPRLLFDNYLYVSGTSKTGREYFKTFPEIVKKYTPGKVVLDIACNDGSQLDVFKSLGYQTYGIDPAKNLYSLSSKNHSVECAYFTSTVANAFGQRFDVIIAQNVFAHIPNPYQFLLDCKKILNTAGYIFIQTSQADMIKNFEFDTIYHEHISYFNLQSMLELVHRAGLRLVDVVKPEIHGTSYVFVITNLDKPEIINTEPIRSKFELDKYAKNAHRLIAEISSTIDKYKLGEYKIVGYGAAAKGNTLLNFGNIKLDYIVDDNNLKQGLYTPGTRIPIKSPEVLALETERVLVIPLAWNFYAEILQKVKSYGVRGKIIKYFPQVSIDAL